MRDVGTPVRAVLVGSGDIARSTHLPVLADPALGVDVVAVVDPDEIAARRVADERRIGATFRDLPEALEAVRPDLVVLCSPPGFHAAQTVAALRAGSWVACEKPAVLSLAEDDAVRAAERPGGPYAAAVLQHRFAASALTVAERLRSGRLGIVASAQCETSWFRDDAYFRAAWHGDYAGDGGPVMALGIHQIDLLLALLGPWRSVQARTSTRLRSISSDDTSVAIVEFESGALATVITSAVSPRQTSRIRVDTSTGTIELDHLYGFDADDWTFTPAPGASSDGWLVADDEHAARGHAAFYRSFLDSLRSGRPPRTTGTERRATIELVTAIIASAERLVPVRAGTIGPDDPAYSGLAAAAGV